MRGKKNTVYNKALLVDARQWEIMSVAFFLKFLHNKYYFKIRYFVFVRRWAVISRMPFTTIHKVRSLGPWLSSQPPFGRKHLSTQSGLILKLKTTQPQSNSVFIMYEQYFIFIKSHLKVLDFIDQRRKLLAGNSGRTCTEYSGIRTRPSVPLSLGVPPVLFLWHPHSAHPWGHHEQESRGLTARAVWYLPRKQEEWALAFSMHWFLSLR